MVLWGTLSDTLDQLSYFAFVPGIETDIETGIETGIEGDNSNWDQEIFWHCLLSIDFCLDRLNTEICWLYNKSAWKLVRSLHKHG